MSGIKDYSTTPASNNATPPNGFPEGMDPASLNDGMRQVMADIRSWYEDPAWINLGHTPTYSSTTAFTLSGDKTATYVSGVRIKASGTTPFTIYGTISSSSYSAPNTTVNVTWDSGTLNATLNAVSLNLVQKALGGLSLTTGTITTLTSTTANIATANISTALNVTSGSAAISGTSTESAYATFAEDTDNGTNKIKLQAPSSIASDVTVTLPSSAGTLALTSEIFSTGCKAYRSTNQSIPNATWTTINLDAESWDDASWHDNSTNPSRITVDFSGRVIITSSYNVNTTTNASYGIRVRKNGTTVISKDFRQFASGGAESYQICLACESECSASDYFEVQVYQNAGGPVNAGTGADATFMSVRRIK